MGRCRCDRVGDTEMPRQSKHISARSLAWRCTPHLCACSRHGPVALARWHCDSSAAGRLVWRPGQCLAGHARRLRFVTGAEERQARAEQGQARRVPRADGPKRCLSGPAAKWRSRVVKHPGRVITRHAWQRNAHRGCRSIRHNGCHRNPARSCAGRPCFFCRSLSTTSTTASSRGCHSQARRVA